MKDIQQKIDDALGQNPDYGKLDNLSADVWMRVRNKQKQSGSSSFIPLSLKVATVSLCLLAMLAVSQVRFQQGNVQADLFDLRFFSYQSTPSLNFASVNTYELVP